MFLKKSPKSQKSLISFLPPKRHQGKSDYIDFSALDPVTGMLKRKKIMLNKYKKGRERDTMAAQIIQNAMNKLTTGWNPWIDSPTTRGDIEPLS